MSRKLVIDDGRGQRELLLVGTMLVGRDPECEISSGDPRLSRRHAELRVTPTGVVVRDLQSRNGVRVNGATVKEATLAPGDVVQVAHLSLRFVDEDDPRRDLVKTQAMTAPVSIAAPAEDDRTRALPKSAVGAAPTAGMAPRPVAPEPADDRTRVVSQRAAMSGAARSAAPTVPMTAVPADIGEIVIREPGVSTRHAGGAESLGVHALASVSWGRRVLLQGLLLALVVFMVSVTPIVAWQSRVFGASALQAWTVLLPPLGASAFAGVMVAGLIARTAVRGRDHDAGR